MTETAETPIPVARDTGLASILIRDLVTMYPQTLAVLAPLGIDLCCGGGHPLGEALTLHGLDRDTVLARVAAAIQAPSDDRR